MSGAVLEVEESTAVEAKESALAEAINRAYSANNNENLFRELRPVALRMTQRILRKHDDAADIAQDAMMKIVRGLARTGKRGGYDPRRGSFYSWACKVIKNTARAEYARRFGKKDKSGHHVKHTSEALYHAEGGGDDTTRHEDDYTGARERSAHLLDQAAHREHLHPGGTRILRKKAPSAPVEAPRMTSVEFLGAVLEDYIESGIQREGDSNELFAFLLSMDGIFATEYGKRMAEVVDLRCQGYEWAQIAKEWTEDYGEAVSADGIRKRLTDYHKDFRRLWRKEKEKEKRAEQRLSREQKAKRFLFEWYLNVRNNPTPEEEENHRASLLSTEFRKDTMGYLMLRTLRYAVRPIVKTCEKIDGLPKWNRWQMVEKDKVTSRGKK